MTLSLVVDAAKVDRVRLEGELPGAPCPMERVAPGRYAHTVSGLERGRWYRYRFKVHRADLQRWIRVSDPKARVLDASLQRWSLLRLPSAGQRTAPPKPLPLPAWNEMVIYELNPREFVSVDTPFAAVRDRPDARGPGQVFRRITERIRSGYFNKLGINVLELMPVTASAWVDWQRKAPERDPWGYAPISWYALNGDYGGPEDFKALVRAAHERGIAVILDYSLDHGHGGKRHGLLTDLFPGWRTAKPKNPWGLLEFDLSQAPVRRFLVGAMERFVTDYGLDGFRMDWTENVPAETWAHFVKAGKAIRKDLLMISENPVKTLVSEAGFHGTWDFFFQWEVPLLLRQVWQNWDGIHGKTVNTQDKLVENLTTWARSPWVPGPLVRYIESHDMPRIARPKVRWQAGGNHLLDVNGDGKTPDWLQNGSPARSRLGATLLATVPGAVMIFAGQEHAANDELKWAADPLDWKSADSKTLEHYRRVLTLRRSRADLRGEDLRVLTNDVDKRLLVYSRGSDPKRTDDDTAVALFNFGASPLVKVNVTLPADGCWRDALSGRVLSAGPKQALDLPVHGAALLLCERENGRCKPRSGSCGVSKEVK